jgi:hypothetical protein
VVPRRHRCPARRRAGRPAQCFIQLDGAVGQTACHFAGRRRQTGPASMGWPASSRHPRPRRSPKIITLSGSPPKRAMLALIQRSAAIWSIRP